MPSSDWTDTDNEGFLELSMRDHVTPAERLFYTVRHRTMLSKAKAWLMEHGGIDRGRADCRHVYKTAAGRIIMLDKATGKESK